MRVFCFMNAGNLYIIATPIGNLSDITLRALETLKMVDIILCEDTRVTKNLLDHFQISKQLMSYHHHSDQRKMKEIEKLLREGNNIGLVTDAGTPGISDPGNQLVNYLARNMEQGTIISIPGVSAVTTALSISGFPTDKFFFLGFPPHKNKRQKFFQEAANSEFTTVFFESGHRIKKCLGELSKILDEKREVVVCRELTKKFETVYRGSILKVMEEMRDERGEFVVVVNQ